MLTVRLFFCYFIGYFYPLEEFQCLVAVGYLLLKFFEFLGAHDMKCSHVPELSFRTGGDSSRAEGYPLSQFKK